MLQYAKIARAIIGRLYGKANTPKGKSSNLGPARKQTLRKSKKVATSANMGQTAGQAIQLRISALSDALFEPTQPVKVVPDPAAPEERALLLPYERTNLETMDEDAQQKEQLIMDTWNRYCGKRAHEERVREGKQLAARVRALHSLKMVSEKWYSEAIKIDYSLAPANRRIATFTMPTIMSISCSKADAVEQFDSEYPGNK